MDTPYSDCRVASRGIWELRLALHSAHVHVRACILWYTVNTAERHDIRVTVAALIIPGRPRVRRPVEPLVVKTEPVAAVVEEYIAGHDVEHPKFRLATATDHNTEPYHFSARRFVCQEAGISGARLQKIRDLEDEFVQFGVADDILAAIGHGYMLGTSITIYANPGWSRRRVVMELSRRGVSTDDQFWRWVEF
jgi:hypothetical protein